MEHYAVRAKPARASAELDCAGRLHFHLCHAWYSDTEPVTAIVLSSSRCSGGVGNFDRLRPRTRTTRRPSSPCGRPMLRNVGLPLDKPRYVALTSRIGEWVARASERGPNRANRSGVGTNAPERHPREPHAWPQMVPLITSSSRRLSSSSDLGGSQRRRQVTGCLLRVRPPRSRRDRPARCTCTRSRAGPRH